MEQTWPNTHPFPVRNLQGVCLTEQIYSRIKIFGQNFSYLEKHFNLCTYISDGVHIGGCVQTEKARRGQRNTFCSPAPTQRVSANSAAAAAQLFWTAVHAHADTERDEDAGQGRG